MYSKQEASLLTQQFWTVFGGYMAPILSAEGEKINWINYKTGVKDIRFIITADHKASKIAIKFLHKDIVLQQLYFDKFMQLKKILHQVVGEEWEWQMPAIDEHGKSIGEIYVVLNGVNMFDKAVWAEIISFLKPRLIALDSFWCEYKYAFEGFGF